MISLVKKDYDSTKIYRKTHKKGASQTYDTPSPPLISVFSPQGKRGNRPTRCSNRFAIRLADHQRSTPAAELRFFVRG